MSVVLYTIAIIILCVLLMFIVIVYKDILFWKDRSRVEYMSLSDLKRMDPFKFETYVAKLYKSMGYSVQQTKRTGDGGKDIVATKDGQTYYMPWESTICLSGKWFYHTEDTVYKSLDELEKLYKQCTKNDNILILNCPPGRDGKMRDKDLALLKELRERIGQ